MIAVTVLYWYVIRRPRLLKERHRTTHRRSRQGLAIAAAPIVVYALAMALAATSTAASIASFFSVPILYFLLITLVRERRGTDPKPTTSLNQAGRPSRSLSFGAAVRLYGVS